MSRRTDYENPRPYKTRSVRKECTEYTKINGVLFQCKGVHGPRAKHWSSVTDDFGRFVVVEWSE